MLMEVKFLRFDGLDPNTMYTIHIATELEGKTVVQVFIVHSPSMVMHFKQKVLKVYHGIK